ncbi:MAG: DUF2461 domain-containing protein [Myxococcales bacterium]|nr:DUF2461 domain-containing protein [Myxococcales bacterium]
MAETTPFTGFPKESPKFLADLARHNNREWFEAHRDDFEGAVLDPARGFVVTLGARLAKISKDLVADPRVDKSIFRLHRDTRFSKDKSPFKTHLGILWWEGRAKKMESPGFYFQLEPKRLMLCAGIWMFTSDQLRAYREALVDPKRAGSLSRAVGKVESAGYGVGGEHYKRLPRGVQAEGRLGDLARHNGLYGIWEGDIPKELHGPEILDLCMAHFAAMAPIEQWLTEHL